MSEFDPAAGYARVWERVEGQGREIGELRSNLNTGFANVQSALSNLAAKVDGNSKTQWPVIWGAAAVVFSVLMGIGGALYYPVLTTLAELKTEFKDLRGDTLTRDELDYRSGRSAEDRVKLNETLNDLRSNAISKGERESILKSIDLRFADLQRQIDFLSSR